MARSLPLDLCSPLVGADTNSQAKKKKKSLVVWERESFLDCNAPVSWPPTTRTTQLSCRSLGLSLRSRCSPGSSIYNQGRPRSP